MQRSLFCLRLAGVGRHSLVLRAWFSLVLWKSGSLGNRSSVIVGTGGQLGTHFVNDLVYPPSRTISFIVLFSQYLKDVPMPLPSYQGGKKCHLSPVYLFQIFPVRRGSQAEGLASPAPGCLGSFHSHPGKLVLPSPPYAVWGQR